MSAAADIHEAATELRLAQSQLDELQREFNFTGAMLVDTTKLWFTLEQISDKLTTALLKLEA